jgi:hypothetical protein
VEAGGNHGVDRIKGKIMKPVGYVDQFGLDSVAHGGWCALRKEGKIPLYAESVGAKEAFFKLAEQDKIIEQLRKELDHCKSNPDNQAERARLPIERADLPIERIQAYARIEELRKGLFVARDVMRVMQEWVKSSDPAAFDWAERQIQSANDILSHKPKG